MFAVFHFNGSKFGDPQPFHLILVNVTVKIYWETALCGMLSIPFAFSIVNGSEVFTQHVVTLYQPYFRLRTGLLSVNVMKQVCHTELM